jgi:hypothetical protein
MKGAIICGVLVLAACGRQDERRHQSFLQHLRNTNEKNLSAGLSSQRFMNSRGRVEAQPFPGIRPFFVLARLERIEKAPCERCHLNPPQALMARQSKEPRTAHWSIELRHATESVMNCSTCHGQEKMTALRTLNGAVVAFDHSYQLCGQCHSRQLQDWAGGAHGKRAGGWTPPRVVYNCVECHNPHQPRLQGRWPAVRGEASKIR